MMSYMLRGRRTIVYLEANAVGQLVPAQDTTASRDRRLRLAQGVRELRKGTPTDEAVEPNVWLWWTGEPIEHIRYFAEKTARSFGAGSTGLVELQRMPALWRFNAYKAARIALMHSRREGGGLQK